MPSLPSRLCVLVLLGFLSGCGRVYTVPSSSMAPTIKPGEVIRIDPSAYRAGAPKRWDVILFEHPVTGFTNIFRVVGLPGETLSIEGGAVITNGQEQQPPAGIAGLDYVAEIPHPAGASSRPPVTVRFPYLIPSGSYFVLGDNSTDAYDSRFWGPVPASSILGRVRGK